VREFPTKNVGSDEAGDGYRRECLESEREIGYNRNYNTPAK